MTTKEQPNHVEARESLYRVVWKFRDGRNQGCGYPISREIAFDTAMQMNKEFPNMLHWIEQVTP